MTDPRGKEWHKNVGPDWRRTLNGHQCGWPDCEEFVAGRLWACQDHWLLVPIQMRDRYMQAGSKHGLNQGSIQSSPLIQLIDAEILIWVEENYPNDIN